MKTPIKKNLKFLTLLITSLLIATASAQVYRYMYMEGTISVSSAKLVWIEGENVDSTIEGSKVTFTLNVEEGTPINFTEAVFLKNVNATGSFNYEIAVTQALSTDNFEIAKIHIYQNNTGSWQYVDTLDLTENDSTSGSLAAGKYLRFTIEVKAKTTVGGQFKLEVRYWA
ncbi:MAG: hypothetical protein ACPLKQ_04705 [Candidatus Bathyarchaeales archaeon]